MNRHIEVKEAGVSQCFDTSTPVGLYLQSGGLWIVGVPHTFPIFVTVSPEFMGLIRDGVTAPSGGTGVSESSLLKAIAIAQRPELAKELL